MNPEKIKETILLVDDNPTNLQILTKYLNKLGFSILIAQNGETAIEMTDSESPDIILMDIVMSGIDGFETCRRLKDNKNTKDIPVIFMSGLSDTDDKVRGFQLGAVDYITKPFQREEILARVTTHLTIQRQKKELSGLNARLFESNIESEISLAESSCRLSESGAVKDKIFSIIAHDVKSAMDRLIKHSRLLSESADKSGDIANDILDTARNTSELLENLLNWDRIQKRSTDFNPEINDLHGLVWESIAELQKDAEQKEIRISHSVSPDTLVYADPFITKTILDCLISNAIKFTHKGGIITVSERTTEKRVIVSVSDTGVGISKDNIKKLLRIDRSYKTTGTDGEKGTGLGLILCRELAEKNRGDIWLESEQRKGTTSYFTLERGGVGSDA
ncbi:hybrid sensor histidine kinase/response regulator [Desulfococcaceae bacterium HSG8]|nr:hybrid sensor histidine kinase/response regulator [Desulfococcaceae bacterium HSG8]